jgi:TolA-binding protein
MKKKEVVAALVIAFFGIGPSGLAQTSSSETARKHLESGNQFYEQGRYKQALNDFDIVIAMADSEYADDALLRSGEYYLDIEGNFDTAREYFNRILQNYPTEDSAPGAYYYLGVVTLRSTFGQQGVDDALANFQRVIMLYPQSTWVPAARYETGTALERQELWEEAADAYFSVISDHPTSRWAPGAQLAMGRCAVRLDQPLQAMLEIQQVRNRYPGSPEAEEALAWLTLLYRFYGYPRIDRPIAYEADTTFVPALSDEFDDVETVRVSSQGIHVLERGRKRLLTFDAGGKLTGTTSAAEPRGLSISSGDMTVLSNERGLLIGGKPFVVAVPDEDGPKPLEHIRRAVRNRLGDLFIYDDDEEGILRFNASGALVGPFPDAASREVLRMELDAQGNVIILEERDRVITVYSPAGELVARIERRGREWELDRPTDIAVDPAGYFYVLDERDVQVAVFDPSYRFLTLLTTENLGGGVLEKPITFDVDRFGDIYVYDEEEKELIRLH